MDVIQRSQRGDGEAFAELFHQHKDLVFRTAYLITGQANEADDVLQEVFIRVHRSLRTYDASKGAFTTWLYRITVNLCLSRQRSAKPLFDVHDSLIGGASPEFDLAESQALEQALNGLTPKQRAVIFLRYYAGLSYVEMADALDVPLGTVQSRLNAALMALRSNLAHSEDSAITQNPARTRGMRQ